MKHNNGYPGKQKGQRQVQEANNQVQYRNAPYNNVSASDVQCTKCARKGHLAQTCRAFNLQCEACQKMGHVKQVCRAGRQGNTAPPTVQQQSRQQYQQPAQQQYIHPVPQQQQYVQPVQQQYAQPAPQQQYVQPTQQQYPPQAQQPPQQQFAQPVVQRQQVNVDGKTRCYQCGQYGHMQRSCPTLNRVNCTEEQYTEHQIF